MDLPSSLPVDHQPCWPFRPHPAVRHPDVQTLLARRLPAGLLDVRAIERPVLVDAGPDQSGYAPGQTVRLLGYYTPQCSEGAARGLVLLLHGWEGCSHSAYNLICTDALLRAGYDVFRLNLRDHGPGYHVDPHSLNRGVFMGTLIDEVECAVHQVAALAHDRPFFIVGASMGGNFALRLAGRHAHAPIHHLARVVAVDPAINPARTTDALDRHRLYLRYFRNRWLHSLRAKQRHFPDSYDFQPLAAIPSVRAMTEWLVSRYTEYATADDYFRAYAVTDATLAELATPVTIVTSRDDKVVPVVDFETLPAHPLLDLRLQPYGGHVGYVDILPFRHRMPCMLLTVLEDA